MHVNSQLCIFVLDRPNAIGMLAGQFGEIDMPDVDRPVDDYDVWTERCSHDYQLSDWGFPCVTYTCTKCGDRDEKDVS